MAAVTPDDRLRALLDAVVSLGGNLDLHATLQRITTSAARLADARYAALGVLDPRGEGLDDFIVHGLSDDQRLGIGPPPRGHGILGVLITQPRPLRLEDLRKHPASYGFPPNHPPMRSFLGVPVLVRGKVFGNLYLTEKRGGGDFTDDDEETIVALAAAAGVAVQNARLYAQAERSRRWLAATVEIQRALLRRVDRSSALALVATHARAVTGRDVAVVLLEQEQGELLVAAVDSATPLRTGEPVARVGPIAQVLDHDATVRITEPTDVPVVGRIEAGLLVPFTGPYDAKGCLVVASTSRRDAWPTPEDIEPLQGFANQAALAMERAQAQADRAALAVLADRDRIARDLHDVVIQRLFATGLALDAAVHSAGGATLESAARTAVDDLDGVITDIRATIFELSRRGSGAELRTELRDIARSARSPQGTVPHLELLGPLDSAVPDAVRPHLSAVLAEALSNATRHSGARHISARVAIEEGEVRLEVCDDGRGFVPTGRESGLRNIRARAEDVGGSCDVESTADQGTVVRWRAPLVPAASSDTSGADPG